MKGKLTKIEVKKPTTGKSGPGPWTLFRRTLIVGGGEFGLANFNENNIEEKLNEFKPLPCFVEFETEKNGKFTNIKFDSLKKIREKDVQLIETKEQSVSESFSGSTGKLDSSERALTLAVELTGKIVEGNAKPSDFEEPVSDFVMKLAKKFETFLTKNK